MHHDHETVTHRVGDYVNGEAHTQGIESFWSMLKRIHKGKFQKTFNQQRGPPNGTGFGSIVGRKAHIRPFEDGEGIMAGL